eukprot:scaffold4002_cov126-Skeletonema_dohrnii-CCMP3373.AAC.4
MRTASSSNSNEYCELERSVSEDDGTHCSRAHKMDFDGRSIVVQMTQLVTGGTQKVLLWMMGVRVRFGLFSFVIPNSNSRVMM